MERLDEMAPVKPLAVTFESLYASEYRPLVRVAFVMLGGSNRAEEVVQDAFGRVYERWSSLDNPGGYLRTCVVNGCRDVLRRQRLAVWKRPDPSPVFVELGFDHLADALTRLSPRQRAAVVLRYYADLPEAEIAEALGVRPGTVKSLLHRGLAQLREEIER